MRYDTFDNRNVHCECVIDGNRMTYDGCSTRSLEKAKEFYTSDKWEYMGEGYTTYHDGVKNEWNELHHFFKRK